MDEEGILIEYARFFLEIAALERKKMTRRWVNSQLPGRVNSQLTNAEVDVIADVVSLNPVVHKIRRAVHKLEGKNKKSSTLCPNW